MNKLRSHYFVVFLLRIMMLFLLFSLCRAVFYLYNRDIISAISVGDIVSIVKGGFVFDSASILYINIPFIFFSLIPFRFREKPGYQRFLMWLFIAVNGLGLMINIADIFYFPFKLSRIASDDLHFLSEGNFGTLTVSFLKDYWMGVLLWLACLLVLWRGFVWLRYEPERNRPLLHPVAFAISQTLLLGLIGLYMVFAIRGFSFSRASYPIGMSDASLYVKPRYASLVLSNPFCLIRTIGQNVPSPAYFDRERLDEIYPVVHMPMDSVAVEIEGRPNVVLIVMESFGSAHVKSFNDDFTGEVSYTPFLDSLAVHSYVCTDAFQNGLRSIDAMPSIWASIPSFQTQFLSLPNSVAEYKALPSCLADMGYKTMFFHGAARRSMSFVSFGQMAGIQHFYSREDYEGKHGQGDFDGKWGIWDHKFLPFAGSKLNETPEPFFATIFTLSSHHPYLLPEGFEGKFPEGMLPIHRVIAYSDSALRQFFAEASGQSWFNNTLFVLTADHGSGGDIEKFLQMPHAYSVPVIFYYPGANLKSALFENGRLAGRNTKTAQHIDLMPTLLRMLGYRKPFFAFGRDMFNDADAGFTINYYGSAYNYMADSMRYVFNGHGIAEGYNYIRDPLEHKSVTELQPSDSLNITRMKAFIQQYYLRLKERRFID